MTSHAPADGTTIAYDDAGDGPAILLLHAGIADRTMWQDQLQSLAAAGYRALAPDIRGFGETPMGEGPFSVRRDVVAVLDDAGVERAHLLGCSIGGGIALGAAVEFPERTISLALVGAGIASAQVDDPLTALAEQAIETAREAGDADGANRMEADLWLAGPDRTLADLPDDLVGRVIDWIAAAQDQEGWDRAERLDPPADTRLDEIKVPVLVVTGERDILEMSQHADALMAGLPTATRVTVPGGHLPNLEDQAAFDAALLEFLAVV